jgi:hypothetical protein
MLTGPKEEEVFLAPFIPFSKRGQSVFLKDVMGRKITINLKRTALK